jgi:hypothetical protein
VPSRGQHFRVALEPREAIRADAIIAGSTFMATSRFSVVSVARWTSPIPPASIAAVIV